MSPIKAEAAGSTVTLTPAQTRALFGDTLQITYFDGMDWVSGELSYLTSAAEVGTAPNFGSNWESELWGSLVPPGTRYLVYSASDLNISANTQYQINLEPQISFTNSLITKFVAGVSCSSSYTAQPRYNPHNYVQYFVNGNQVTHDAFTYNQGSYSWWLPIHYLVGTGQYQADRYFLMYPCFYNNDSVYGSVNQFSFTADAAAMPATNICRFIVSCPTLSESTSYGQESGQTGTDLTATNQKLDTIISILSMIAQNNNYNNTMTQEELVDAISDQQAENLSENGPLAWLKEKFHNLTDRVGSIVTGFTSSLTNLFSPNESAITSFKDSIDGTLRETFGSMYSDNIHNMLTSQLETQMTQGSGMDAIVITPVSVDLAGTTFKFPPTEPGQSYTVSLRPAYDHLRVLYDALAMMIDVIAVFAVFNMLKNKWESVITDREVTD